MKSRNGGTNRRTNGGRTEGRTNQRWVGEMITSGYDLFERSKKEKINKKKKAVGRYKEGQSEKKE